jgi:DNA-binding NarL/FixJ family response regulator
LSSLVEALAEVLDPREARGVRHGVLAVLLLGECAVLTGARSFAAVAEYAHDAGRLVLAALGVGEVVRHESTLRRVLQKVDATALEAALRSWAMAQLDTQPTSTDTPRRERRRVLALDGKTLRGARIRRMLTVLSCRIWCRSSIRPAVSCSGRSRSRRRAARSPRTPRCSTPSTYARCWSPRTPCIPLVARGLTNREIAAELVISAKTASVHVSHILRKLDAPNRLEAAAIAHRIASE